MPRAAGGGTDFTVWAPHAARVELVLGEGSDAAAVELPAQAHDGGYWHTCVEDAGAGTRYSWRLDGGELRLPDPASGWQPEGPHAPSAVVDHAAYPWSDDGWFGRPLREWVIYEMHVGTFTPQGTFDAVVARLAQLAQDGITAIELLPVAQFPGTRNWGYDGVDLYAPQNSYGGPEGLKRLVDAAHAHGIAVVLDVVYNHLGPEGNYLSRFGPYFSDRHATLWGQAVNVDGPGSDEVRRFFIENALQWVRDYHVDGLRLDAVHAIVDTSAQPFLAELAAAVEEEAERLNRRVHVIAESDLNDVRVITSRECGGFGHHAQWTDDFHHALHTLVTGEGDGYYADFNGLRDLATSYRQGFVYTGQPSASRGRRHGSRSAGLPGERFVVYAQNHDQVGNRLLGDRLAAAITPELQKVVSAAVLLAPFVPMIFMGEEYGETAPFPYFVSHTDKELVQAVREGRSREFESFGFTGEAPDPQGEATFRSAVLDWEGRDQGSAGRLLAWNRELLRIRRSCDSIGRMRPDETRVRCDEAGGWLTLERSHRGDHTLVILDFAGGAPPLSDLLGDGDAEADWSTLVHSLEPRFGGDAQGGVGVPAAAVLQRTAPVLPGART